MRQPQSASFHIADGNLILAIEQSDDGVELKVLDTHIKHDITHRVWGGTLDDLSVILEEWAERHQPAEPVTLATVGPLRDNGCPMETGVPY